MRKALLLPGVFLIVVGPLVLREWTGNGTDMSKLLLYPFASPWWLLFNVDPSVLGEAATASENLGLTLGCAINAVLLGGVGFLWDRMRQGKATL